MKEGRYMGFIQNIRAKRARNKLNNYANTILPICKDYVQEFKKDVEYAYEYFVSTPDYAGGGVKNERFSKMRQSFKRLEKKITSCEEVLEELNANNDSDKFFKMLDGLLDVHYELESFMTTNSSALKLPIYDLVGEEMQYLLDDIESNISEYFEVYFVVGDKRNMINPAIQNYFVDIKNVELNENKFGALIIPKGYHAQCVHKGVATLNGTTRTLLQPETVQVVKDYLYDNVVENKKQ